MRTREKFFLKKFLNVKLPVTFNCYDLHGKAKTKPISWISVLMNLENRTHDVAGTFSYFPEGEATSRAARRWRRPERSTHPADLAVAGKAR